MTSRTKLWIGIAILLLIIIPAGFYGEKQRSKYKPAVSEKAATVSATLPEQGRTQRVIANLKLDLARAQRQQENLQKDKNRAQQVIANLKLDLVRATRKYESLAGKDAELPAALDDIKRLKTELEMTRLRLRAAESEIDRQNKKLAELEQQRKLDATGSRQLLDQTTAELKMNQLRLQEAKSEIDRQNKKLAKLGRQDQVIKGSQQLLDETKAELDGKIQRLDQANKHILALSEKLAETKTRLAEAEATIAKTRDSVAEANSARLSAEQAAKQRKSQLDSLTSVRQGSANELNQLKAELAEATTALAVTRVELEQSRLKADALLRFGQEKDKQLAPAKQDILRLKGELLAKQKELDTARDEIAELQKTHKALNSELENTLAELGRKNSDLQDAGEINKDLSARLRKDEEKLTGALDNITNLNKLVESLLAEKTETNNQLQARNAENENLKLAVAQRDQRIGEIQGLADKNATLEKEIKQLRGTAEQLPGLRKALSDKQAEADQLTASLEKARQGAATLEEEKKALNVELTTLRDKHAQQTRELEDQQEMLTSTATTNTELRNTITQLQQSAEQNALTVQQQLDGLNTDLKAKNEVVDHLHAELDKVNEANRILTGEKQAAEALTAKIEQLQTLINEKEKALASTQAALAGANQRIEETQAALATAAEQKAALEGRIQALAEALADMQNAKKEAEKRAEEVGGKGEEFNTQINQLNQTLTSLREEKDSLQKQLEAASGTLTGAQAAQQEVDGLRKELSAQQAAAKQEQERLNALLAEKEQALSDLSGRAEQVGALGPELAQLRKQAEQLGEQIEQQRRELEEKNQKLAEAEQKLAQSATPQTPRISNAELNKLRAEQKLTASRLVAANATITGLQAKIETLQLEHDRLLLHLTDSDNDSVSDAVDKCQDTPQGFPVDDQGCPTDADNDQVFNGSDLCPDTPKNAVVNELGCANDETIILKNVSFASGTANLDPNSRESLEEVKAVLAKHEQFRFEVAGHTDSVGDPELNKQVSMARAESVRQFLIERGIDPQRLVAKGYGPDQPIADNNTYTGRAANRRVELRLITQ